ncbi:hypothetical protein TNCV_4529311 [Trichonephila clavipes]|uniref:Uncharacterized protein n=1 Tax=Trichonephila clavipes TaxID=2585209 RepID=A0A8X6S0W0_TRICX|nr:hypothetical protein TNCV_4529311 [Trichonephila clavipes]
MKQKQQTKNKHCGSARARSDQWIMDKQNRLKSTLEGKINRIETFIESAKEETDSVEIKVKLRSLIQLKKKRGGTSHQLLRHFECERCRVNCRRRRSPSS